MTTHGSETENPSQHLHCGCCGRQKPASRLTQLGSTPGVYICSSCALWASFRARGIAVDRLNPRALLHRLRLRQFRPSREVRDQVILAIPILPSSDLTRTTKFYALLGFDVVEQVDTYLVMNVDQVEVHFIDDDPQLGPGLVFLNVPEVDLVWKRLTALGTSGVGPVQGQFGLREFMLTDPDGSRIRVGHATGE